MKLFGIQEGGVGRLVRHIVAGMLAILLQESVGLAQVSLNVTNYGAYGDAVKLSVNCVSNSSTVTTTNLLSSADVGKVIEIFGGGPLYPGSTNVADNIAIIQNVLQRTNIVLNRACQYTTNNASAIYGTEDATGFQSAVNASSNSIINIPAGNYLLIPPQLLIANFADTGPYDAVPAVVISQAGIEFLGDNQTNTILYGCGAWRLYPDVIRGYTFLISEPLTNYSKTLTFENLTFDGGVARGNLNNVGWPADHNGGGWDVTHGAVLLGGDGGSSGGTPTNVVFENCTVQHWRGEMIKSTDDEPHNTDFTLFTNCNFIDGDASALNWELGGHLITGCYFSNLDMVEEDFNDAGIPSCFSNNMVMVCTSGITLSGASSNYFQMPYLIISNNFQAYKWSVNVSPAQNVTISGNYFHDGGYALLSGGAGGQGSGEISNIVFINNTEINQGAGLVLYTGSHIYVTNNYLSGFGNVYFASGSAGNLFFINNTAVNLGSGTGLNFSSTYPDTLPLDDLSNQFPYHQLDDFSGQTNLISYTLGTRHFINATHSGSVWCLDDGNPWQIPAGAVMIVTNGSGSTLSLYLNSALTGRTLTMTNGFASLFEWTKGAWQRFNLAGSVAPPSNLRMGDH